MARQEMRYVEGYATSDANCREDGVGEVAGNQVEDEIAGTLETRRLGGCTGEGTARKLAGEESLAAAT